MRRDGLFAQHRLYCIIAMLDSTHAGALCRRIRARLVLNVRHDGDPRSAKEVVVNYSTAGKLYEVRGGACVMACWNIFIPYLAPELPAAQKQALAYNVKGPIVYTNVFLRNWKAFHKLGISYVECPTMYHAVSCCAFSGPAALTRPATSLASRSIVGRMDIPTPTTVSTIRWSGCSPKPTSVPA